MMVKEPGPLLPDEEARQKRRAGTLAELERLDLDLANLKVPPDESVASLRVYFDQVRTILRMLEQEKLLPFNFKFEAADFISATDSLDFSQQGANPVTESHLSMLKATVKRIQEILTTE